MAKHIIPPACDSYAEYDCERDAAFEQLLRDPSERDTQNTLDKFSST